ncbi:LytR/AlgR family response regulator transcription factor [Faecalibaculum rodentium]|uniref:LytR/AlgR family response regulator transcription factor n=1 Tax=Faecalibaculum rodentium TaxID=1702221 RepID=UPI0024941099|nr:LytTR family DNA-binding domain-containing protein [Faecalibaculum rodentium]
MIRIAILEHEKETKEIVFLLARVFRQNDWVFRHYFKASELARKMKEESYQIFIFDEMFRSPRMESVFVHDNPDAVFIYLCEDPLVTRGNDDRERIFYLGKNSLAAGLDSISQRLVSQSSQNDHYTLVYDGTHVNIPYQEIFYVEKIEKMVWFHTRKGVFHKRMNMSDLEKLFSPYGFLRVHVSYLVNRKHIRSWHKEDVELVTGDLVPLSRAQKRRLRQEKDVPVSGERV